MQYPQTVLVGQALQYRDKLNAKRHIVPKHRLEKWKKLMNESDKLVARVNPHTRQKHMGFNGSISDLRCLLSALIKMDRAM